MFLLKVFWNRNVVLQVFWKFFSSTEVSKSVKLFENLLCLENVLERNPTFVRLQKQDSKSVINTSVRKRKRSRLWNIILSLLQLWLITLKRGPPLFPFPSQGKLTVATVYNSFRSRKKSQSRVFSLSLLSTSWNARSWTGSTYEKRRLPFCKRGLK